MATARPQPDRTRIIEKFENYLEGRNIAHICRRDGQPRFVIYAFREPQSKAYERNRLAPRHFDWIARLIDAKSSEVQSDYVKRGGVIATKAGAR